MTTRIELEDTFGDITRKASSGNRLSAERLAQLTGIERGRIERFIADKAQPTESEAHAVAKALRLDPAKLADSGLQRWYPQDFAAPGYLIHQINRPQPSNGYFLVLRDKGVGAFVDPAGDAQPIVETFKRAQVDLQYILLTHKHLDHTDALVPVRKAFPKARPVMHELDAVELGAPARDAISIRDGDRLPFGDGEIAMLHTPGHTDGSACFIYEGAIFTGDEMFAGSVGRVFGERFGYDDQLATIRSKILSLPEDTVVLPGHGPASTVGQERAHNPFF